jgi:hypothetical protein
MKNSYLRALLASLYIVVVALIMNAASRRDGPETIVVPIAVLSLFTLSAAVMGYLFLVEPVQLYLSGERKEAVRSFSQTVAAFAALTTIALVALFFGIGS